jgi:hypothetical protein
MEAFIVIIPGLTANVYQLAVHMQLPAVSLSAAEDEMSLPLNGMVLLWARAFMAGTKSTARMTAAIDRRNSSLRGKSSYCSRQI